MTTDFIPNISPVTNTSSTDSAIVSRIAFCPLILTICFLIGLSGCTAINYKQGLLIHNAQGASGNEGPASYGADDSVAIEKQHPLPHMHMLVRLGHKPVTHVLAAGPFAVFVPLPIVPWPPGIIGALVKPYPYERSPEKLHIRVLFDKPYLHGDDITYDLDLQSISLTSGAAVIHPSTVTYIANDSDTFFDLHESSRYDATGCTLLKEQSLRFFIDQAPSGPRDRPVVCDSLTIQLTFDITYAAIHHAELDLGDIKANGASLSLAPFSIDDEGKFILWFGPSIAP